MQCPKCGNTNHSTGDKMCRICGGSLPERRGGRTTGRSASGWMNTDSWKRYMFHRLEGPPVELTKGKMFTFGRSSDCDLTIKSPNISRRHAEISWDDDVPILKDLGSQNGSQVNGKPVWEHRLEDNDEITIGPFTCTFRIKSGRGSLRENQELLDSQADTQSMMAVAMTGDLEEVSLYEVLDGLSYNKKTGTLEVFNQWDAEGRISLKDGVALFAECGNVRGDKAILDLLAWGQGRFRLIAGIDDSQPNNVRNSMAAILEKSIGQAKKKGKPPPPPKA